MKICPNCNAQLDDNAAFCGSCGANLGGGQQQPVYTAPPAQPAFDPYDHTAEYEAKDISENKVFAMLVYLLGTIGIIIALLASSESPYTKFHVRQALKFTVVEVLTLIATFALIWTFIVPIAGVIFLAVLGVIKIICFVQICMGKAKEPVIIRNLPFLR